MSEEEQPETESNIDGLEYEIFVFGPGVINVKDEKNKMKTINDLKQALEKQPKPVFLNNMKVRADGVPVEDNTLLSDLRGARLSATEAPKGGKPK